LLSSEPGGFNRSWSYRFAGAKVVFFFIYAKIKNTLAILHDIF